MGTFFRYLSAVIIWFHSVSGDHPPDRQGKEDACLVTAEEAKQLVPQLLIAYYQSHLCFV
jgi:hypothetical protein